MACVLLHGEEREAQFGELQVQAWWSLVKGHWLAFNHVTMMITNTYTWFNYAAPELSSSLTLMCFFTSSLGSGYYGPLCLADRRAKARASSLGDLICPKSPRWEGFAGLSPFSELCPNQSSLPEQTLVPELPSSVEVLEHAGVWWGRREGAMQPIHQA